MFTRILRRGCKGQDVAELQRILNAVGQSTGPADGYFGEKTEAALRAFQIAKNLKPDGVAGAKTFAALGSLQTSLPPETRPIPKLKTLAEIDTTYAKGSVEWYEAAFLICEFDPGTEGRVAVAGDRVLAGRASMYAQLERARGIPWYMAGVIHSMECNCNPNGVLHNGQPIIGTGLKTTIVPKGRGPFSNWLEAALDAVDSQALWRVPQWSIGWILKQCEAFNGLGYLKWHHAENSPYLWACTNINDGHGKYTSDGRWDSTANANAQVGAGAILKYLERTGHISVSYQKAA